jgi:methyl-accepting chemotaxis protein
MLKNMKITTRLIISSVVLLAPIAVMLYLVMSGFFLVKESENIKAEEIFAGLEDYRTSVEELIEVLETTVAVSDPGLYNSSILEKVIRVNSGAASINRLDTLPLDRINGYRANLLRTGLIALLTLVLAFVIVAMTGISVSRSIARLGRVFKSLHDDDLSLTVTIESRDEFEEMLSSFNLFLKKLRTAFVSFSESSSMVSTAVYDLSASAREISATANEQSASVAEIVTTMEGNTILSGQISLKTSEVVNLMTRTREFSQRGAELWEINQDMMRDIRHQDARIVEGILNLADMISHIDEIISIIDVIADQTKLIAFNASLEASSSGEEGVRFAVVAGEMRRFAAGVAESTAEIKEKIEEIQTASRNLIEEANEGSLQIDDGYARMAEQKIVFENILEVSQSTEVSSRQISNLSRQQELASSQIFQALKEISEGVKQFVVATTSTSKIADILDIMSVELQETVNRYRTGGIREKETGGRPNGR